MHTNARNDAIDFVKGFLVVIMTLGHTLMYFVNGRPFIRSYTFCARPAFVFFAGVLCGAIYLGKFQVDKKRVSLRLLVRGLKLLVLFFGTNILIHLALAENYTGQRLGLKMVLDNLGPILFSGQGRLMAFEILVPISYVLLLSVPILYFARFQHFLYVFVILTMVIVSLWGIDMPFNVYYGLFGVAGICSGLLCATLKSQLRNQIIGPAVALVLSLYLFLLIPGGVNIRGNLIIAYVYVNSVIAAFYLMGAFLESYRFLPKIIITLGRYSLYLYLAQIFLLQIFYKLGMSKTDFITMKTITVFVAVSCVMTLLAYFTDSLRSRFLFVDKVYRFVFA